MEDKYKVGMKVFLSPLKNRYHNRSCELIEGVVTKVGRKYFYVMTKENDKDKPQFWEKFERNTFIHVDDNYGPQFTIWPSQESFTDFCCRRLKWDAIREVFAQPFMIDRTVSDEQLDKIFELLEENGAVSPIKVTK